MGSTFLQLTNETLRRMNEVELTESNFNTTRGLQSSVKDAVKATIAQIQSKIPVLNYMAYQRTQVLSVGVEEYPWLVS